MFFRTLVSPQSVFRSVGRLMKVSSVMIPVGFLISLPVLAEPYAEWGMIGDQSLTLYNDGATIPPASDVPIPLAPGGAVVAVGPGDKKCLLGVRTRQSVEDTCAFYKNALNPAEYQSGRPEFLEGVPGCGFFRDGDYGGFGVDVTKSADSAFQRNGATLVTVTYRPGRCE